MGKLQVPGSARGLRIVVAVAVVLAAGLVSIAPARARSGAASVQPARALKSMSLEQLFDLEVTSVSQKPESLSRAAAAVHVVTQDDLRRSGVRSFPEALRYIPGVEVARVDARQYAITARGFNGTVANKLLVLIDGRSVYTPLYSGVFWDAQDIFLDDVEQIEVIRGPGATVWGANAVNGVINVISRDARETQGLLITGGAGSEERGFGGVRYGAPLGDRGAFRIWGQGFDRDGAVRSDGSDAGDDVRMGHGGMRADWTPDSETHFTLQGDAYGGAELQPGSEETRLSGGNLLARWSRQLEADGSLEARAYYDRTDRSIPTVFEEALDTYDLELRHRRHFGDLHDLVWGVGLRLTRDDVRNSASLAFLPARLSQRLYTLFVQDELPLGGERMRLTLGSKLEHNDYTGVELQPSARLAWSLAAEQTLWAAASRAVRAPSRIDREFFIPGVPPYLLVGAPEFESEVLRAFEVGYKAATARRLTTSVAGFYHRYDELRSVEPGSPITLGNGLEGRTYGVELDGTWQASPGWRLTGGWTHLRIELDRDATSTDPNPDAQEGDSPRDQLFARSSWTLPRGVAVDAAVRHVGALPNQQVPAYTSGDARLGWQASERLELSVVGQNLFDERHAEFGAPASRREVERSVYARATCRF